MENWKIFFDGKNEIAVKRLQYTGDASGAGEGSDTGTEQNSPGNDTGKDDTSLPWPWIIGGAVLALAVIGAALVLIFRRRKKKKAKEGGADPSAGQRPAPAKVPQIGKLHQQGARKSQQDCFSVSPADLIPSYGLLAVVADGMGGLSDGDKVSQAAVTAIMNGFYVTPGKPEELLLTLLSQANDAVNELLGADGRSRSGSTLVAGLVRDNLFYSLSVGDSRVCLYRDGTLYQLNREHTFVHELELRAVNRESDFHTAYTHPKKGGLTSFLGMGRLKYVDLPAAPVEIRAGDKFVLMTDGVYNALSQAELTACLDKPAEEAAQLLDEAIRAKNYSNQDNYTAVILAF